MIDYSMGVPTDVGVYACRVPKYPGEKGLEFYHEDIFLFWDGARWGYLSSDQNYRGPVPYWLGPLPRFPNAAHWTGNPDDE